MIYVVCSIFVLLSITALLRGYTVREIGGMILPGVKNSFIVVTALILIGCLTGLWRGCGTIAFFVSESLKRIPPSMFVLASFLIPAFLSYSMGTAVGVSATAGVILVCVARAADVSLLPVAGAVMSGIYVGDRNSPAASSAILVATVTDTDLHVNVKKMFASSAVPLLVCTAVYACISFAFPMKRTGSEVLDLLAESFHLNWVCLLPALMMVILPICRLNFKITLSVDILLSMAVAVFVQKESLSGVLKMMFFGYNSDNPVLAELMAGGGLFSMLEICVILVLSGTFGGLMDGIGLLEGTYKAIHKAAERYGRFVVMILLSLICCAVFCNQTVGVIMVSQLSKNLYTGQEKYKKMIDIENSTITLAGMVPWCLACSLQRINMKVSTAFLLWSFYLWLLPVWHLLNERISCRKKSKALS